mgnify:CR=1 FL=1
MITTFNVQGTVLLQDLNLNWRTNLKLEYNIKSLNYIQNNFIFQASFLLSFTMFDMISGLKVIKIGNDCITLQFA